MQSNTVDIIKQPIVTSSNFQIPSPLGSKDYNHKLTVLLEYFGLSGCLIKENDHSIRLFQFLCVYIAPIQSRNSNNRNLTH